jgi:hypothetical protein
MADNFFGGLNTALLNNDANAAFYAIFPWATGTNPLAQFARSRQPQYMNQFSNALLSNPNLTYTDFFRTLKPEDEFGGQAPSMRGINYSQFSPRTIFKNAFGGGSFG